MTSRKGLVDSAFIWDANWNHSTNTLMIECECPHCNKRFTVDGNAHKYFMCDKCQSILRAEV